MKVPSILAALALAAASSPSMAQPVTDCPLRDAPFSASSPLIDILLSPAARAVVERELGMSFDDAPPHYVNTEAPTFAAILTLKEATARMRPPAEAIERADAALRALPVTDADKVARCARYDNEVPPLSLQDDRPNILVFQKINGFVHEQAYPAARKALEEIGQQNGWNVVVTDKAGAINPDLLDRIDAVVWNNVSGDVLTLSQRQALRDYVEGGGGFVGLHGSGGDPAYFWDWYADTLIGARFAGHPRDPQFQEARVIVDDPSHPAAEDLPGEWRMTDEWYSFKSNPRDSGARIVARLDESTYDPGAGIGPQLRMGEDHPIAWSRIVGKGRSFYSAFGHRPETYDHPHHRAMLEDAVAWTAGLKGCDCEAGPSD